MIQLHLFRWIRSTTYKKNVWITLKNNHVHLRSLFTARNQENISTKTKTNNSR